MAGGAPLTSSTGIRLLALLAVVLLAHLLALQWLARQLEQPAALRPLPTPMFTRLLRPQAPAAEAGSGYFLTARVRGSTRTIAWSSSTSTDWR